MTSETRKIYVKINGKANEKTLERIVDSRGKINIQIKQTGEMRKIPVEHYIKIIRRQHPGAIVEEKYGETKKVPFFRRYHGILLRK